MLDLRKSTNIDEAYLEKLRADQLSKPQSPPPSTVNGSSRKSGSVGSAQPQKKGSLAAVLIGMSLVFAIGAIIATVVFFNDDSATTAAPVGTGTAAAFIASTSAAPLPLPGTTAESEGPRRGYNKEEFLKAREQLLKKDLSRSLGASLVLDENEKKLDAILLKEKKKWMEQSRKDRVEYIPAVSFFRSKKWMENTKMFDIIRKMPKGAALHIHEPAIASLDWLVKNATYREHVYMCYKDNLILLHRFLPDKEPSFPECADWKLVADERKNATNVDKFDEMLRKNISMLTSDPLVDYPTVSKVWDRFNNYFMQVIFLVFNEEIFKDYITQAMQEFYDDNVQFMEIRGAIKGYTDLNGTQMDATDGANMFHDINKEFLKTHSDFIGINIIWSGLRTKKPEVIEQEVKEAMDLRKIFKEFFAGFDLVAQEDPNYQLLSYADALLLPTKDNIEDALPYFFHAAETNWQGTVVDDNLVDAILLNTTRIGHGYGLGKHPELADIVKKRGIAVEINPISNQVLGLVKDLRNHAMVPLLADDFPLVISSDDPATWEALPMTHDFMVAFLDMSSQDMGLAFLKQLAINSIKYSSMGTETKERAMKLWESKWKTFVEWAVKQHSSQ